MTAALKWNLISVEEYLANEPDSPPRHEYVDGILFRRPDECIQHNDIAGNLFGSLAVRLRGGRFRPWTSATKACIKHSGHVRFYYPDASVIAQAAVHDESAALFEVLSKKTRRIDMVEKFDAYLTMPSLKVYVLIEQDSPLVVTFRRTDAGFIREVHEGLDAILPLDEIEAELPLAEIYDGVEFVPEPDEDDAV